MNILRFLTPKSKVAYIYTDYTLRQALEKMEYHRYTAIPMIDRSGIYVGTLTEGDLLWAIKNDFALDLKAAENVPISQIARKMDNAPARVDTSMEDLVEMALEQNFIPVTDDRGVFIGIVTRKDVIVYCIDSMKTPKIRSFALQEAVSSLS